MPHFYGWSWKIINQMKKFLYQHISRPRKFGLAAFVHLNLYTIPTIFNFTPLSRDAPLPWLELENYELHEKVSLSSYLLTQKVWFSCVVPCSRNFSFSGKSHFSTPRPLGNCPQKLSDSEKMPRKVFLLVHFEARICWRVKLNMVI